MTEEITKYLHRHGYDTWEPRAALFDMDGILYDSMPNHAIAWHNAMRQYGISMSCEEAYTYEGMRGVETIRLIVKRQLGKDITEEEAAKMYSLKAEYYAVCQRAELIPGVHQLQEDMKDYGLHIGVVTGSAQPTLINRILEDFSGLVSPDIIVTALNIEHGKPAPDPYIKGMEKAGTAPSVLSAPSLSFLPRHSRGFCPVASWPVPPFCRIRYHNCKRIHPGCQ